MTFYWNDIWNSTGMLRSTPQFLFFNLWLKMIEMVPEISQEHTWIIPIRDKNLLQDHPSNIHTSTEKSSNEFDFWLLKVKDKSWKLKVKTHKLKVNSQKIKVKIHKLKVNSQKIKVKCQKLKSLEIIQVSFSNVRYGASSHPTPAVLV